MINILFELDNIIDLIKQTKLQKLIIGAALLKFNIEEIRILAWRSYIVKIRFIFLTIVY